MLPFSASNSALISSIVFGFIFSPNSSLCLSAFLTDSRYCRYSLRFTRPSAIFYTI